MGASSSVNQEKYENEKKNKKSQQSSIQDIFEFTKPIYYIPNVTVTKEDIENAKLSWNLIINDKSSEYVRIFSENNPNQISCLTWFHDSFYARLFDVHPSCRPLFKNNMIIQGKALVKLITTALGLLDDLNGLVPVLINLAKFHTKKGVLAHQYGIVGEVLLWTLKYCLGDEFDEAIKLSWIKIYSLMLSVMLPAAIEEELNSK